MVQKFPPVAVELLSDFCVSLYRLFGVHAVVHSDRLAPATHSWDEGRPTLCEEIRRHPSLLARCDEAESSLCHRGTGGLRQGICHAGLRQMVVPLRWRGYLHGWIICSPFRHAGESPRAVAGRVFAAIGQLRVPDEDRMVGRPQVEWFARQIPVLGGRERASLQRLVQSFFGTMMERLDAGLPEGFRFHHMPLRGGQGGEWLSYLWVGPTGSGADRNSKGWSSHRHQETIVFASKGSCCVEMPRRQVTLSRGELMLLPAGTRFRVRYADQSGPWWLLFTSSLELSRIARQKLRPLGWAAALLRDLVRRADGAPNFNFTAEGKLRALSLLIELRRIGGTPAGQAGRSPAPSLMTAVDRALAHIEAHKGERISLAELAGVARAGIFALERAFRRELGVSPIAYHRSLRMEEARRLLATTRTSIKSIAQHQGYTDLQSFGHAFRSATGVSPREYRSKRPMRKN